VRRCQASSPSLHRGHHTRPTSPRWNAAGLALQREHERLTADAGDRVRIEVPGYAYVYGTAVLRADDALGRELGWVTRADLILWHDLIALARAAARLLTPEHTGQRIPRCAGCDLHRAVSHLRSAARNAGLRRDDGA
jgi:hypothetical protein